MCRFCSGILGNCKKNELKDYNSCERGIGPLYMRNGKRAKHQGQLLSPAPLGTPRWATAVTRRHRSGLWALGSGLSGPLRAGAVYPRLSLAGCTGVDGVWVYCAGVWVYVLMCYPAPVYHSARRSAAIPTPIASILHGDSPMAFALNPSLSRGQRPHTQC